MGGPKQIACTAAGVWLLAAASPASAQTPPVRSASLRVQFALQVGTDPPVKGQLTLDRMGQTCVEVTQPIAQRMWLDAKGAQVYYPATQQLFHQRAADRAMPAFLDAVMAGLADPTGHLPQGARLLTRKQQAEQVTSTWRVSDRDDHTVQHLQVRETRAGVQDVVLRTEKGQMLRQYQFGPRTKAGKLQIPASITASYHAGKGKATRLERWQLTDAKALSATTMTAKGCLNAAAAAKESAW